MPLTRASLTSISPILLGFVLALSACSGATSGAPPAAGTSQQAIATTEPGPLRALGAAFAQVPLSQEQRVKIEGLFKAAETRHAEAWKTSAGARKDLLLALAEQVEKGAVDKNALAPKIDAVAAVAKSAREQDQKALLELHATLSPEQRAAFVDALGEPHHMWKKGFGHAPEGEQPTTEKRGRHDRADRGHHFGHAFKELNLSDEQKEKLKEAMKASMGHDKDGKRAAFAKHREEAKQALESFKSDKFTGELMPPHKGGDHIERMVRFAETATPILTPEQRTKAAQMLRERAAKADEMPGKH